MKKHWKNILLALLGIALTASLWNNSQLQRERDYQFMRVRALSTDVDRLNAQNWELTQTLEELRAIHANGVVQSISIIRVDTARGTAQIAVTLAAERLPGGGQGVLWADGSGESADVQWEEDSCIAQVTLPLRRESGIIYQGEVPQSSMEIARVNPETMLVERFKLEVYLAVTEGKVQLFPFVVNAQGTDGERVVKAELSVVSGQDTWTWDLMPYERTPYEDQLFNGYMTEYNNLALASGEAFLLEDGLFAFDWDEDAQVVIALTDAFGVEYETHGGLDTESRSVSMGPVKIK